MSMSVCLFVCRSHNSKTTRPNFTEFLCVFSVAVARSFSGGVAIRYVLPVLWMTSCFHKVAMMACYVYSRAVKELDEHNSQNSNQPIKTGRTHRERRTGGKVCHLQLSCCPGGQAVTREDLLDVHKSTEKFPM